MKVTSSQQMMSMGDFPSLINENLLRYRKMSSFPNYGHTENVLIPQPLSKMYFLSLRYAESFRYSITLGIKIKALFNCQEGTWP